LKQGGKQLDRCSENKQVDAGKGPNKKAYLKCAMVRRLMIKNNGAKKSDSRKKKKSDKESDEGGRKQKK